ncbi:MAG: response regulator [Actinobacteria bacterium]|nr:response regulator [Actinomycetota bacterium]MBV9933263.1 response regulator [Actinomycetota bacterium]
MADGRVLVVDDEEGIRVLCRVNLELGGFEVVEASDGVEALEKARAQHPDLVFLDLMMPRMDGWQVLDELKNDATTANIPVVILTARTSEEDQMRGWGGGILDYLAKPFNPQRLVEWAEQAMQPRTANATENRKERAMEQLRLMKKLRES